MNQISSFCFLKRNRGGTRELTSTCPVPALRSAHIPSILCGLSQCTEKSDVQHPAQRQPSAACCSQRDGALPYMGKLLWPDWLGEQGPLMGSNSTVHTPASFCHRHPQSPSNTFRCLCWKDFLFTLFYIESQLNQILWAGQMLGVSIPVS